MTELTHAELLQNLANARIEEATWKAHMKNLIDDVKNSDDYKDAESRVKEAEEAIEHLSLKIKVEALETFHATGTKKQEGVTVKEIPEVTITDEAKAREWCFTNLRKALTFDKKVFADEAKDKNNDIPAELVTVTTKLRADIASDLSKYLPSAIPGPEQSR